MFEEEEDFDFERHKQLPVFKKAEDILIMAEKLAELINDSIENKLEDAELMMAKSYTQNILENLLDHYDGVVYLIEKVQIMMFLDLVGIII